MGEGLVCSHSTSSSTTALGFFRVGDVVQKGLEEKKEWLFLTSDVYNSLWAALFMAGLQRLAPSQSTLVRSLELPLDILTQHCCPACISSILWYIPYSLSLVGSSDPSTQFS